MRLPSIAFLVAASLALTACDDPFAPGEGGIEVTLAVNGVDGDLQAVGVTIAGELVGTLSGPGSLVVSVASGRHTVRLDGIADNCTPLESLAQAVAVTAGDTSEVRFRIECRAVTGSLLVRSLTDGPDLDFAIGVSVDGGETRTFSSNGQLLIPGLAGGLHSVVLAGLNANCVADGSDSLTVAVPVGRLTYDTAYADFRVTCAAVTGWASVVVTTTGKSLDPDGYTVSLTPPVRTQVAIEPNDTLDLGRLPPGSFDVTLTGLASNCAGVGPLTRPLVVAAGSESLVAFAVRCLGPGTLRVTTATTGSGIDPSFDLTLDGVTARTIGSNAVALINLPAGSHQVGLAGVALQCAVGGTNPLAVAIAEDDTTDISFAVGCVQPGTLRVGVQVSGASLDPTFQVTVDGSAALTVPANGSVAIDVAPGQRSVLLGDIAGNCSVTSGNPVSVTVAQGTTVDVTFSVTCVPRPRTGADISIVTTGSGIDSTYILGICSWGCYYYGPDFTLTVSSNGTVQLDLAPGTYYEFVLEGVASNCTGEIIGSFSVVADQVTPVGITMNCGAPATARVTAAVTGPDAPTTLTLRRDGWNFTYLAANIAVDIPLIEGSYEFELVDLPSNCSVAGANPVSVILVPGAATNVTFSVLCTQWATLVVTTTTSGVDPDSYYWVEIDGRYAGNLGEGGVLAAQVASGTHAVLLKDVAANCTVTDANPASVTVVGGEVRPVAFTVTCAENPTLQVTVATTGANIPSQFLVGVDPDWYYGYARTAMVGANGSASLRLAPGVHWVTLDNLPLNCRVTSANNVAVTLVFGAPPLILNFAVVCQ